MKGKTLTNKKQTNKKKRQRRQDAIENTKNRFKRAARKIYIFSHCGFARHNDLMNSAYAIS